MVKVKIRDLRTNIVREYIEPEIYYTAENKFIKQYKHQDYIIEEVENIQPVKE